MAVQFNNSGISIYFNYLFRDAECTVLCPKRLECAPFQSFIICSVILAMDTLNIPKVSSIYADYFDNTDKTSGDSHVTTMAVTIR